MRGLFWKFFTITWLMMAASIAGLFAISALLDVGPLSQDIAREQRAFTLDVAERLLEQEGKRPPRRSRGPQGRRLGLSNCPYPRSVLRSLAPISMLGPCAASLPMRDASA